MTQTLTPPIYDPDFLEDVLICYDPDSCCLGGSCFAEDSPFQKGTCWGGCQVEAEEYSDDDYWWVHACEGHRGTYESPYDAYSPKQYEPLFRLPDGTFGLRHVVPGLGKLWWGPTLTPPVLPA